MKLTNIMISGIIGVVIIVLIVTTLGGLMNTATDAVEKLVYNTTRIELDFNGNGRSGANAVNTADLSNIANKAKGLANKALSLGNNVYGSEAVATSVIQGVEDVSVSNTLSEINGFQ